jgi:hypothetical protein
MEMISEQLAHVVTHATPEPDLLTLIDRIEHVRQLHHKQRVHDRQWYDDRSILHASLHVLRALLTQAGGTEPGRSAPTHGG